MRRTIGLAQPPRSVSMGAALQLTVGTGGAIGLWGGGLACTINGWLGPTVHGSTAMAWGMLALYGALAGIGLVVNAVRAVRHVGFLSRARLGYGRLVEKKRVGSGKSRRFELLFEYRDPVEETTQVYRHLPRRWGRVTLQSTDKVTDEPEEPLLYDPADPERIQMIDALPGYLAISERGGFVARSWYLLVMTLFAVISVGSAVTLLLYLLGMLPLSWLGL